MATERPPRWQIDEVLDRTDLAALLDELARPATYNMRGRRWHCPVPNHDDHHASVTTHTDARGHQRWRCWSGEDTHRGDAIDLVAIVRGVDRRDAIDWLATRAGMHPDRAYQPPVRKPPPSRPTLVPLDPAVVRYVQACEQILWTATGRPVLDWLTDHRGLQPDVLRANHVGADPGRATVPRTRGLPRGERIAATFPALDQHGAIRYVQTRYLQPVDGHKYDNPAAALGTNPRLAWTAPASDPHPGVLIVCEGIPDALTAAQAGYLSAGVLGAQYPDSSVATRLATRAQHDTRTIVAITDGDPAGRAWGQRLGELLAHHDQNLTVLEPPGDGLDLNEWALRDPTWTHSLPRASTRTGLAATPPGPSLAARPDLEVPGR